MARHKGDPRRYTPDDRGRLIASALAGVGTPDSLIALKLGISEATLRKHYAAQLGPERDMALVHVMIAAFESALVKKNVAAQFQILRARHPAFYKRVIVQGDNDADPIKIEDAGTDRLIEALARLEGGDNQEDKG